jgi:hypothetical protein
MSQDLRTPAEKKAEKEKKRNEAIRALAKDLMDLLPDGSVEAEVTGVNLGEIRFRIRKKPGTPPITLFIPRGSVFHPKDNPTFQPMVTTGWGRSIIVVLDSDDWKSMRVPAKCCDIRLKTPDGGVHFTPKKANPPDKANPLDVVKDLIDLAEALDEDDPRVQDYVWIATNSAKDLNERGKNATLIGERFAELRALADRGKLPLDFNRLEAWKDLAPKHRVTLLEEVKAKLAKTDDKDKVNTDSYCKVHPVKLAKGKKYRIRMNAADTKQLDPYLRLEDAERKEVASNDDAPGEHTLNSRIDFLCDVGGNYRIIATSLNAGATGDFTLLVFEGVE